ncbi:hypothetical protein GYMLUDRAFT_253692 [Collybiopsis luxurians FD-317 M1]|uniref:Uncharacterized protein n=1 Tax=Collybiopsis luxurians FD-317 M1 TaxID=944289 RepID=A0A0D0BJI6_9AGAR|nr:hypothetical protein GYMLUDRAFT_253692 [Collybiopsis luxurians FD-317 M1]
MMHALSSSDEIDCQTDTDCSTHTSDSYTDSDSGSDSESDPDESTPIKTSPPMHPEYNVDAFQREFERYEAYLAADEDAPEEQEFLQKARLLRSETMGFIMQEISDLLDSPIFCPIIEYESYIAIIKGTRVGYFSSWDIARRYLRVVSAKFSFHATLFDARLCYLRALIGQELVQVSRDGKKEVDVFPDIPSGYTFAQYWDSLWIGWVKDAMKIPSMYPSS